MCVLWIQSKLKPKYAIFRKIIENYMKCILWQQLKQDFFLYILQVLLNWLHIIKFQFYFS